MEPTSCTSPGSGRPFRDPLSAGRDARRRGFLPVDAPAGAVRKLRLYEGYAVPEYWYIDFDADRIEVYRLEADAFSGPMMMSRGNAITSSELPRFNAQVDDLLGPEPVN